MKSLSYILREMGIGALSCLLVFSVAGLSYAPSHTPKAEALASGSAVLVVGGLGTIQETLSAIYNYALQYKELILDPIAWYAANLIIQRMTQDIVRWINSGFQGQPAFMRDFGGFLTGIADSAVGEFIASDETLRFLCSPFRLDIQVALSLQYAKGRNYGSPGSQCTLTGVTANLQEFFNGNRITDWNQWFKVTQDPQYNPYGSLLMAQEQMSIRLSNTKGQQASVLAWGKGFLSSQECNVVENRNICRTITPGTTIEEALNDALGNPSKRIAVADEINEILVALFSQLVSQAFSGAGGLLGLTGGSGAPTGSTYFTQITQASQNSGTITSGRTAIATAAANESTYLGLMQGIVADLEAAARYRDDTYGAGNSCHPGTLTTNLQSALTRAQSEIAASSNSIATLNAILARFDAAVGQPDQVELQNQALQDFLSLQSTTILHGQPSISEVQQSFRPEVNRAITAFQRQVDTACNPGFGSGGT